MGIPKSAAIICVIIITSLLMIGVPVSSASDGPPTNSLRVSLMESFWDFNESDEQKPLNDFVLPVIDSDGNLQYSAQLVRSNENGTEVSIVHIIKMADGGYVNSSVTSWHFSQTEWEEQRYHWTQLASKVFLNSLNEPYILYQLDINAPEFQSLAFRRDGNWTLVEIPLSVKLPFMESENLVIDEHDRVHIAYVDENEVLKYMNNAGGDWNAYSIDNVNPGFGGFFYNIRLDIDDVVHIYYRSIEFNGIEASMANGVWRKNVIFEDPGRSDSDPRYNLFYMTQDSENHYHIYYAGYSGNDYVFYYMTDSSSSWINVTVPGVPRTFHENTLIYYLIQEDIDGTGYHYYGLVQALRWDGMEWQTSDLLRYYEPYTSMSVQVQNDGDLDVISMKYEPKTNFERFTITDHWPTTLQNRPSNLVATSEDGLARLSWEGSENAIGYRIYCKEPFTDTFAILGDTNSTRFVDDGFGTYYRSVYEPRTVKLYNGLEYQYTVTTLTAEGESAPSNFVSVTPRTTPDAPEDLFAFYDGNSVALIWIPPANDGGADITGYDIACKDLQQNVLWNVSLGNVTVYDTGDFVPGEAYMFRVTAKNAAGAGGSSSFEYVVPSGEEVPFYVLSQKSSTSNVRFDNDSQTVTFTVSGSDGSLGSSFVVIPKALVGNGSDLRATIDGSDLPIMVQETDSAYIVTMSYHHSTHEVLVYWGEDAWLSAYILPIVIGVIATLGIIGCLLYVRRKKNA